MPALDAVFHALAKHSRRTRLVKGAASGSESATGSVGGRDPPLRGLGWEMRTLGNGAGLASRTGFGPGRGAGFKADGSVVARLGFREGRSLLKSASTSVHGHGCQESRPTMLPQERQGLGDEGQLDPFRRRNPNRQVTSSESRRRGPAGLRGRRWIGSLRAEEQTGPGWRHFAGAGTGGNGEGQVGEHGARHYALPVRHPAR